MWGGDGTLGEYALIEPVSSAPDSHVLLARHLSEDTLHVIKIVDKMSLSPNEFVLYRELVNRRAHSHPSLARLEQVLEDDQNLFIVSEACLGERVADMALRNGAMHEHRARHIFQQIINAAMFCEANSMLHWLRLESIIDCGTDTVKIADATLGDRQCNAEEQLVALPQPFRTVHYRAPELLANDRFTAAGNAWTCGCALYLLLTGALPYWTSDSDEVLRDRIALYSAPMPLFVSSSAQDLIGRLLDKRMHLRYTLSDVAAHPWFKIGVQAIRDETALFDGSTISSTAQDSLEPRQSLECPPMRNLDNDEQYESYLLYPEYDPVLYPVHAEKPRTSFAPWRVLPERMSVRHLMHTLPKAVGAVPIHSNASHHMRHDGDGDETSSQWIRQHRRRTDTSPHSHRSQAKVTIVKVRIRDWLSQRMHFGTKTTRPQPRNKADRRRSSIGLQNRRASSPLWGSRRNTQL